MSTIVKKLNQKDFLLFVKGSPEKIFELCVKESIPESFHTTLDFYAQKGFRILAFGVKKLNYKINKIFKLERDDVENNLIFVGFIIMENKLKSITKDVINDL